MACGVHAWWQRRSEMKTGWHVCGVEKISAVDLISKLQTKEKEERKEKEKQAEKERRRR